MHWHAEVNELCEKSLTLRGYHVPQGFSLGIAFQAVGTINLLEDGKAFAFGFMSKHGEMTRADWISLAHYMRTHYGVKRIESKRKKKKKQDTGYDTDYGSL